MIEDYMCYPMLDTAQSRTKDDAIKGAREYLHRGGTNIVGIYKLVAIVRSNLEFTIEVVDGDE
jgi:hypothetical protein